MPQSCSCIGRPVWIVVHDKQHRCNTTPEPPIDYLSLIVQRFFRPTFDQCSVGGDCSLGVHCRRKQAHSDLVLCQIAPIHFILCGQGSVAVLVVEALKPRACRIRGGRGTAEAEGPSGRYHCPPAPRPRAARWPRPSAGPFLPGAPATISWAISYPGLSGRGLPRIIIRI